MQFVDHLYQAKLIHNRFVITIVEEEIWVNLSKATNLILKTNRVVHTTDLKYLTLQLDQLTAAAAIYRTKLFNEFSYWDLESDFKDGRGMKPLGSKDELDVIKIVFIRYCTNWFDMKKNYIYAILAIWCVNLNTLATQSKQ